MKSKIILPLSFITSSISLLTWGGIEANNFEKYKQKMEEYEKRLDEFWNKRKNDSLIKNLMCKSLDECMTSPNKSYLPKPNENYLWEKAYKSLQANRKDPKNVNVLPNVKNFESLKDFCYEEIRKDLLDKGDSNHQDFNPTGGSGLGRDSDSHDRCLLSYSELKE